MKAVFLSHWFSWKYLLLVVDILGTIRTGSSIWNKDESDYHMKKKRYHFLEILYQKDKITMKYTLDSDSFSFHSFFSKYQGRGSVYEMDKQTKCHRNE